MSTSKDLSTAPTPAIATGAAGGEPVAWRVRGYGQFRRTGPSEWRYFNQRIKPAVNNPDECDFEPLFARPAPRQEAPDSVSKLAAACENFRDIVLNQRGQLEEPCLDNDQTNAVLSAFDEIVGDHIVDVNKTAAAIGEAICALRCATQGDTSDCEAAIEGLREVLASPTAPQAPQAQLSGNSGELEAVFYEDANGDLWVYSEKACASIGGPASGDKIIARASVCRPRQGDTELPQLTEERINTILNRHFVTGENQYRQDGYYYRSLGAATNVRGADLVRFARDIEAEAIRAAIAGAKT